MIKVLVFLKNRWQVVKVIKANDALIEYYKQNFVCVYPEAVK